MFSIGLFSRYLFQETVLNNSLAASAFLLLYYDPYWIWNTGFQLSYAAVLRLRLFSKPVENLILLQNKMLSMIWNAASVSIAAHVLTTPVSTYYFHRFPSYFLIAKPIAVPLSSGILVGGICLCLFFFIPPIADIMGRLLGILVEFLNVFIRYISHLPGAVIGPMNITMAQLELLYLILFCFYRFLCLKEKIYLLPALALICLFQILRLTG